jgi:putative intracellular protease/amidase
MKLRMLLVTTLLIISATLSNPTVLPALDIPETSDVKVLMLIADSFGWNYFDAREIFESWGVNVTSVAYSIDHNITSCPRPDTGENETILVEYTHQEMTPDMVAQFDCLFVPSGGQWSSLIVGEIPLTFIADAYNMGLIVASVCTGTRVVSEAHEIVNGSKVVSYSLSSIQMNEAGATPIYGMEAVADGRMITGGRGGGLTGGGYLEAPTSEVCAEVVRQALGWSRVTETSLIHSIGPNGSDFTINAVIDNLNDTLGDILSTDTQVVTAYVYSFGNRTLVDTIELTDDNHDGNYTGQFTVLEDGEYTIDIEVEDSNSTLEVVKEVEIFDVGFEPINFVLISAISGGGIIIIVLVLSLIRKK